ncbi:hypothetical protein A0J61_00412 [Choanephora cucurbitarum]|uniref:Zn(2)-C6 fungal-type domain-containing protein n=1 Tax=Choanephora cucurbitarum TaxID=101091 RepID=A0A1C7NRF0_9FUNG|nr:hypothetical protein A0J61_00412 [Choanephora cucurbitarum]
MSDVNDEDKKEKSINFGAACFRCRGFRHACDRKKPSCSRCCRKGITCIYPEAAPSLKKLQKATETLSDRIRKFNERLKMTDTIEREAIPFYTSSVYSSCSDDELQKHILKRLMRRLKIASTYSFSLYPCNKCFKDLQQCDLTLPKCSRCEANNFECHFEKTEPKANHVSQVLNTMNKVMDEWQDSVDRMTKDFAQKTKELSAKANSSLKIKPIQQTSWKITTTQRGLSMESNVSSYNDFSTLVDQFKRSFTVSRDKHKLLKLSQSNMADNSTIEFDDVRSIHTSTSFALWSLWAHPLHEVPQDYPIEITQELTDNLIDLYCRTPCCSSIRLPIVDTNNILLRYKDTNPSNRPSTVLVYAICAMAARNAFQLHVWSKRPSFEAPHYNMGKALSIAYCLRGRELLSDCFDEPSYEHCLAAFLLSYCSYQNGYAGVIYYYEWIAYNMAQELGLYNPDRQLNRYEAMLIWQIYYCNAWYKALQGGESSSPVGLSQCRPQLSTIPSTLPIPKSEEEEAIEYYVWNSWVYLIRLQVLREQSMAALLFPKSAERNDSLPEEILKMQAALKEFHCSLPEEWKSDSPLPFAFSTSCCSSDEDLQDENKHYKVDIQSFSRHCVDLVRLNYSTNEAILYQAFAPMHRVPVTSKSSQCLETSISAANAIVQLTELMTQKREGCFVPFVCVLFANIVYCKLLTYTTDDKLYETGRQGLLRSLDVIKRSKSYMYDFELTRNLANAMEQDTQHIICQQAAVFGVGADSSVSIGSTHLLQTPSSQHCLNDEMFGNFEGCRSRGRRNC